MGRTRCSHGRLTAGRGSKQALLPTYSKQSLLCMHMYDIESRPKRVLESRNPHAVQGRPMFQRPITRRARAHRWKRAGCTQSGTICSSVSVSEAEASAVEAMTCPATDARELTDTENI